MHKELRWVICPDIIRSKDYLEVIIRILEDSLRKGEDSGQAKR